MRHDTLRGVTVKGQKEAVAEQKVRDFTPGQKKIQLDSLSMKIYQQQSVAQLLQTQSSVFVKSYGINGVATLNLRGSSAAQSQVLWNGIPIQNAAMGLSDVSLLPVALFDNIALVYGSSAALTGSGNVGGALLLENSPPRFKDTLGTTARLALGAGSFNQYQAGWNTQLSSKKLFVNLRLFGQKADNNFEYHNLNGSRETLLNSQMRGGAALINAAYKLNDRHLVEAAAWLQHYERKIPPALFENESKQTMQDQAQRYSLQWKYAKDKTKAYARLAYMQEGMKYRNPLIGLSTDNRSEQLYAEIGISKKLNRRHEMLAFIPLSYAWIPHAAADTMQQRKVALALAHAVKLFQERLQVAANLRLEQVDKETIFLPGINAAYQVTPFLSLKANVQKTFRAPTLNERFYDPGGNPSLLPERGWTQELGYSLQWSNPGGTLYLKQEASVFNRLIRDWIVWFGGSIWTPHNIARVWSRGLETDWQIQVKRPRYALHLGVNTAYTLATTSESYMPNDGSIGKQIPYTPRYQVRGNAGGSLGAFTLNYLHSYTGYRFVTVDESQFVMPYHLGAIQALYKANIRKRNVSLSLQVNNIWNTAYQVVAFRPMPGRYFLTAFSCELW